MFVTAGVWLWTSGVSLLGLGVFACCCSQEQQQQQQQTVSVTNSKETKRVCPECGIENPEDANHCGDCGFSFRTGENND